MAKTAVTQDDGQEKIVRKQSRTAKRVERIAAIFGVVLAFFFTRLAFPHVWWLFPGFIFADVLLFMSGAYLVAEQPARWLSRQGIWERFLRWVAKRPLRDGAVPWSKRRVDWQKVADLCIDLDLEPPEEAIPFANHARTQTKLCISCPLGCTCSHCAFRRQEDKDAHAKDAQIAELQRSVDGYRRAARDNGELAKRLQGQLERVTKPDGSFPIASKEELEAAWRAAIAPVIAASTRGGYQIIAPVGRSFTGKPPRDVLAKCCKDRFPMPACMSPCKMDVRKSACRDQCFWHYHTDCSCAWCYQVAKLCGGKAPTPGTRFPQPLLDMATEHEKAERDAARKTHHWNTKKQRCEVVMPVGNCACLWCQGVRAVCYDGGLTLDGFAVFLPESGWRAVRALQMGLSEPA